MVETDKEEDGNPKREPSSEINPIEELFKHHRAPLGSQHVFMPESGGGNECGMNCAHRINSISCPFFQGIPCLVGCEIKLTLPGEGMQHQEMDIFVTSQSGKFLIGHEVMLNMENPRASHIRIITNKRGEQLLPAGASEGLSLFGLKEVGFSLNGVLKVLEDGGIDIHQPLEFPIKDVTEDRSEEGVGSIQVPSKNLDEEEE
jgi:hypothetical protein